jgi:hypothetical protein
MFMVGFLQEKYYAIARGIKNFNAFILVHPYHWLFVDKTQQPLREVAN